MNPIVIAASPDHDTQPASGRNELTTDAAPGRPGAYPPSSSTGGFLRRCGPRTVTMVCKRLACTRSGRERLKELREAQRAETERHCGQGQGSPTVMAGGHVPLPIRPLPISWYRAVPASGHTKMVACCDDLPGFEREARRKDIDQWDEDRPMG
jgi:hypothetical protein